jgi:tetratricopeptide (TPR) repeat protein
MKTIVSGQAGVAILIDEENLSSIDIESSQPVPRSAGDVRYLVGDATDLVELEGADVKTAAAELDLAWRKERSLHLALILLDSQAEGEARALSAECLDEFLTDSAVHDSVGDHLYVATLPERADLPGALSLAQGANLGNATQFLQELAKRQPEIRHYREAWDVLPPELFASPRAKELFGNALVRAGAFRQMACAQTQHRNEILVRCLLDPQLHGFPEYRSILMAWVHPERLEKLPVEGGHNDEQRASAGPQRDAAILEVVNRQKETIRKLLSQGERARAFKFVDELVQYQVQHSSVEETAKSLCDLARHAKEIGDHAAQLDLALRAVAAAPADGWSHAQLGDAYLCTGEYRQALNAYELALIFGEDQVGLTGRAGVLKAQGRLDEALLEYDRGVCDFPYNPFARSGRAEVLKALGRLDEALLEYDAAVLEFPNEVVVRSGRAEVLKAQGKLDDALREYDNIIMGFRADVVTRNGRAEVLKAQGKLDDALREYDDIIMAFPGDVVARTGRAEVLKAQGRFDEALRAYDEIIADFVHEAVPRNGRAEVLKAQGKLEEALRAYDEIIVDFPQDSFPRNGRAEVLKAQGKFDEALRAYDEIVATFSGDVVARVGRAEALKAQGKLDEALQEYDGIAHAFPHERVPRTGRASTLCVLGNLKEALASLSVEAPRTLDDWIDFHVRGMILLKQGATDTAVEIFERGVQESPWFSTQAYFRRALALARLKQNELRLAAEAVGEDSTLVSNVLRIHIFGGLGDASRANHAYEQVKATPWPAVIVLSRELAARYGLAKPDKPVHSDEWVLDREWELLLKAA